MSTGRRRWVDSADHRSWLREQARLQLRFGERFPALGGGSAYLDDTGAPDPARPVYTWVTARMLHVYSLGDLAGVPGSAALAGHALRGLLGPLRDGEHGGWFASIGPAGARETDKSAYAHAFVVFAASSATVAGLEGGRALLDEALEVLDARFWEEAPGLHLDSRSRAWDVTASYRGVNANMHAVEALLAASDATGDPRWRGRAARITRRVLGWAAANDWRIPEHFDAHWQVDLEYHRDQPDHPFEPYGATVGHGLEWSRLALHVAAAQAAERGSPELDPALVAAARELFARAVADGWAVDGADGFVYTTDWAGRPVVRQRMHWVLAEAISAAGALATATGDPAYERWYRTWWDHAVAHVIRADGSWQHELTPDNGPAASVWAGRPDLYHSFHAVLLPRLPLAPCAPVALERGLLR